jgi:AraC-like DNA-binding protein
MYQPILEVVYEIKQTIDNNPLNRKKLISLVADIYINRNKIQVTFKKATGMTIAKYRLKKRMEAAAGMITEENDITVQELAYKCGYKGKNGASNFSRDFKRVHNTSPTQILTRKGQNAV